MKKSVLLLSFFFIATLTFGQGLVNGSFENWTPFAASGGIGEYPTTWTTTDSITKANGGVESAWKDTDAFAGSYSLHLKTSQITYLGFPIKGPAIATNGIVNLVGATFEFSGGSPEINRPRYYSGNFKYAPAATSDSGYVSVYLLKRNGANRDTIAIGFAALTTTATYSQFLVMMNYRDFSTQPDTCLMLIQSSKGTLNGPTVALNSELIVDSLNTIGTVGIDETNDVVKSMVIYPNPASERMMVEVELASAQKLSYDIFDSNGRLIRSGKMASSKEEIEVAELSTGNYVLKLNGNGKAITAKTFSISR